MFHIVVVRLKVKKQVTITVEGVFIFNTEAEALAALPRFGISNPPANLHERLSYKAQGPKDFCVVSIGPVNPNA